MAGKKIPKDVKEQIENIMRQFNKKADCSYVARYRGTYLYLDRKNYFGEATPICRLQYSGDMNDWEFAVFKYSSERYDPDEWMFPGMEHVDGTIEGAMKAGLQAYPD